MAAREALCSLGGGAGGVLVVLVALLWIAVELLRCTFYPLLRLIDVVEDFLASLSPPEAACLGSNVAVLLLGTAVLQGLT